MGTWVGPCYSRQSTPMGMLDGTLFPCGVREYKVADVVHAVRFSHSTASKGPRLVLFTCERSSCLESHGWKPSSSFKNMVKLKSLGVVV